MIVAGLMMGATHNMVIEPQNLLMEFMGITTVCNQVNWINFVLPWLIIQAGDVSTDATIQTCWDADRLDLGRVGIFPSAKYLSQEAALFIDLANDWSTHKY